MNNRYENSKGFTLIEMIMVIVIFSIISAISFVQFAQNRKNNTLLINVENMALKIREAQSKALAVTNADSISNFKNGFGVNFSLEDLIDKKDAQNAGDDSFVLFTDYESNPGPGGWDRVYMMNADSAEPCGSPAQPKDECVEKIKLESADRITKIETCASSCSDLLPGNTLSITFLRPNLDAFFCIQPISSGGCRSLANTFSHIKITVTAPTGISKKVVVWSTGQISIE